MLSDGSVYVDTTLVQAAASMDSGREREERVKPLPNIGRNSLSIDTLQ